METQVFQTNPKLRGLLLILIFTFAASGIALAVLAQIQSYHREQIYLATESSLPKRQSAEKEFISPGFEFSFRYPSKLALNATSGTVSLSHQIPYKNIGDCDMKGGNEIFDYLTDFRVSFEMFNGTVKQAVLKNSPYMPSENYTGDTLKISPGFIDPYKIGNLSGFAILEGAEGCGRVVYYLPIGNGKVLIVDRANIQTLSFVIVKEIRDEVLAVPGVITPEENEKIFRQILQSLKINSPSTSLGIIGQTADWKTYRNEKYGFEFGYPPQYEIIYEACAAPPLELMDNGTPKFCVESIDSPIGTTFEKWLTKQVFYSWTKQPDLFIDGHSAQVFQKQESEFFPIRVIALQYKNRIYEIYSFTDMEAGFLFTFKFIPTP